MKAGWLIGLTLLLAGCAPGIPMTVDAIRDNTVTSNDPYDHAMVTKGVYIRGDEAAYYLYRTIDRNGTIDDRIGIEYEAKYSYAYLGDAHDIDATRLPVSRESRARDGSFRYEAIDVLLPPGYIENHAQSGINVRIEGKNDDTVVVLDPAYVQGFLAALARDKMVAPPGAKPPAAASSPPIPAFPPTAGLASLAPAGQVQLGLTTIAFPSPLAPTIGLNPPRGLWVVFVIPNSPAAKAGIVQGDVVLTMDGQITNAPGDMLAVMAKMQPGQALPLTLWRVGKETPVTVPLGN